MVSDLLIKSYRIKRRSIRQIILKIVSAVEGGELKSSTLREIFKKYYKIEIGYYSHGGCFIPGNFDKYTKIGRYCSIAITARAMNRNHPMEYKSTHALFFNPALGLCEADNIEYIPLNIGNDVWIGHHAIIMPNVQNIQTGAVIGAGAVVNKDVPPYAVVVGNPARVVRYRFAPVTIDSLLKSRWWEKSIEEIVPILSQFQKAYEI